MMLSENEVYESALKKFGIKKQMIKYIEELSELQKELCKQALGQANKDKLIEEMADVEIMLEQMKIGLSIGFYELNEAKGKKVCRLIKVINTQPENPEVLSEEEKELQNEAKCQQCMYSKMTKEELDKLEADPCDTCRDLCNWQPKEVSE